jgi:creatinine amidohydrolase
MPIIQIENLPWPEVDKLDRERTLLIQPVSPIEEHGPHLPLGVDIWVAEYFADELAARFASDRKSWNVAVLPSLVLGSNAFTAPGTISIRPTAMRDVIYDTGESFARHGFRYLMLASGHGAAGHLIALEEATVAIERRYGMKMVSLSSKLIPEVLGGNLWHRVELHLGRELTANERAMLKGDTHGGLLETSFILKMRPELVKEAYKHLEPFDPSFMTRLQKDYAMRDGHQGYVGYPAAASIGFGEAALQAFVELAYERMIETMENPHPEALSMLTRVPFLRPGWKRTARGIAALVGAAFAGAAFVWIANRNRESRD